MRVLAVAESLLALHREAESLTERSVVGAGMSAEVVRNRAVVSGDAREGLARQASSSLRGGRTAVRFELLRNCGVVGRIDDDGDIVMIFCGSAHQRGAADIDILDRLFEADVRLRDGLLERI